MKYEIIHLSDFHVRDNFNYELMVEKIIDSLLFEDIEICDTVFLCITGDVAFSGQKKQYMIFDNFLEKLSCKLNENNKKMEVLVVPGNHDIQLNKEEIDTRHDIIRGALDNNDFENEIKKDINNMKHFFSFSKKYGCFNDDKFISIKEFELNGKRIKFNLLNTACFSSIKKDDKNQHYINPEKLDQINFNDDDINITLMHHSHEWFDEKCQFKIEEICKLSSFYLLGHSHKIDTYITDNGLGFINTEMIPVKISESKYSIFLLDIDNDRLEQFKVEYDNIEQKFVRREDSNHTHIFSKIIKLHNLNYYHNYKNENSKIVIDNEEFDFDKLFVFPLISTEDDLIINNEDELFEFIYENKIIFLDGLSGSGKTTLSKKIFNSFLEKEKTILFVNNAQLITNNYNKSLKNVFLDNYNKRSFDSFLQLKREEKVIIFDGINIYRNEKLRKFIENCLKDFDIVILGSNNMYGTRKELFDDRILFEAKKIKIESFSRRQRRDLIEKISKIYDQLDKIELINNCVESTFVDETFVNLSSPDNLSMLIKHIVKEKYYEERDTKDSFTIIFENNIVNKIKRCVGDSKVEDALILLREIAYFMFNKERNICYFIDYNDILFVFNKCKSEWGIELDIEYLYSFLKDSKIMKLSNNMYSFTRNSYFAYFIAKYIVDGINSGEDYSRDIKKLLDSITFGNYSDVLLFIAYFNHSSVFFAKIIDDIENITKLWTKISFDSKNHYILNRIVKEGFIASEIYENKEQYDKRRDRQERKYLKAKENQLNEKLYNQSEKDNGIEDILKVIKLIEILSKGISGYKHLINKTKRTEMLSIVINNILKVIYKVFDLSNEEYEEFYNEIKNKIISKKPNVLQNEIEKQITNMLYDLISTFSLNIITGMSNIFVTKNSVEIIDLIKDFDEKNDLIFDNVLIKCICFERYGNEEKFIDYILKVYERLKTHDQRNMIKRILYHFIVTKSINYRKIEMLCSKLCLKKDKILSLNPDVARITNNLTKKIGIK